MSLISTFFGAPIVELIYNWAKKFKKLKIFHMIQTSMKAKHFIAMLNLLFTKGLGNFLLDFNARFSASNDSILAKRAVFTSTHGSFDNTEVDAC